MSSAPQKISSTHLLYPTYHYGDQNIADQGWGCSYRNAQTLASALGAKKVPTLPDILSLFGLSLPKKGDTGGQELWIEPPQVAKTMRSLCGIDSTTLVHARSLRDFERDWMLKSKLADFDACIENRPSVLLARIDKHFEETKGLPIIIDDGIFSYVLAPGKDLLLYTLIDPHVCRGATGYVRELKKDNLLNPNAGWMVLFPHK